MAVKMYDQVKIDAFLARLENARAQDDLALKGVELAAIKAEIKYDRHIPLLHDFLTRTGGAAKTASFTGGMTAVVGGAVGAAFIAPVFIPMVVVAVPFGLLSGIYSHSAFSNVSPPKVLKQAVKTLEEEIRLIQQTATIEAVQASPHLQQFLEAFPTLREKFNTQLMTERIRAGAVPPAALPAPAQEPVALPTSPFRLEIKKPK